MEQKDEEIASLPATLTIGSCTVSCLFLRDIGNVSMEQVRDFVGSSGEFANVDRHVYDKEFFNPSFTMTPLSFSPHHGYCVEDVSLPTGVPAYYENRRSSLRLLCGCTFKEQFYFFSNGVLVYQIIVDIGQEVTTDDVIFLTNCLIKHNPTLTIACDSPVAGTTHSEVMRPHDRLEYVHQLISSGLHTTPRTATTETYSCIIIQNFSQDIEKALAHQPSLRLLLYQRYENEFHALCVRTIEDWAKRFPPGATFSEVNSSLSPVGILRVNFRNFLTFEYPYSKETVEKLYYTAIIELRAWAFILSIFLNDTQEFMEEIGGIDIDTTPVNQIEAKRQAILRALDDFNGYAMSTARRTRHFYEVAINLFEIQKITELLLAKLAALQDTIAQQKRNSDAIYQKKIESLQVQSLDKIQRVLEAQETTSVGITLMNILVGSALAFNLGALLSLRASNKTSELAR